MQQNMADNDDGLDRALEAARERGQLRAAEILSGEAMLSGEAFAELLGVSRATVNAKSQRREILALEDANGDFRFPAWQVDASGRPFEVLPTLFELLGDSPWTVYRFLDQHHPELGGATARGPEARPSRPGDRGGEERRRGCLCLGSDGRLKPS